MPTLFYRELGENHRPILIILHGLFGSSDNWLTLGKRYAEHFHVYLVDQRNHGQSFHDEEFTYQAMAEDLHEFFKSQGISYSNLMGHSMGGKTVMEFAVNHPEGVEKLIVADMAPKSYPVRHQTILKGLFSIDLDSLESRRQADEVLSEYVKEMGVRQFLLKNLARTANGFAWRINLDVISKNIEQVGLGLNENYRFAKDSLFIRGGNSDYVSDTDSNLIHSIFQNASIETLDDAGHWLHAEQPEQYFQKTMSFLQS